MVYSSDILNNNSLQTQDFTLQNVNKKNVELRWQPSGIPTFVSIHTISGPTPLLEIGTSIERNDNSSVMSTTTSLSLNGTLVNDGPSAGISGITNKIKQLTGLFNSGCGIGTLSLYCNSIKLTEWTDVRFVGSSFNNGSDNWTNTCPYSINLEQIIYSPSGYNVRDMVDNWTVEQLENTTYTYLSRTNVTTQTEGHNPGLGLNNSPPAPVNGALPISAQRLDITTVPRFRISRTVSAIGKASGCTIGGINNTAYLEAKRWVEDRSSSAWSGINAQPAMITGMMNMVNFVAPTNASTAIQQFASRSSSVDTYFYNYLKTTNTNILQGSYEINETFLAMPTGIGYTEEYTVDMSTDDRYISTVKVAGTINGLALFIPNIMNESHLFQKNEVDSGVAKISLSGSTKPTNENIGVLSNPTLKHLDNNSKTSNWSNLSTAKYRNAASGWLNDIKPYLYRRACFVMNSSDRDSHYVHPTQNPPPPLKNPAYSFQRVVNMVPINTTETHDPRKGTINYSYEFNNAVKIIPGTLFEKVTVDDSLPTDVISEAFVMGRALGPVLQNLQTKTSAHKSLTIEIGVVPPSSLAGLKMQNSACPLYFDGDTYRAIQGIVSGFQPYAPINSPFFGNIRTRALQGKVFVESDVHNWNATQGRYTRSIKWIYQRCDEAEPVLSH